MQNNNDIFPTVTFSNNERIHLKQGYQPPTSSWWCQPSQQEFMKARDAELPRMMKARPPEMTANQVGTTMETNRRRQRREGAE